MSDFHAYANDNDSKYKCLCSSLHIEDGASIIFLFAFFRYIYFVMFLFVQDYLSSFIAYPLIVIACLGILTNAFVFIGIFYGKPKYFLPLLFLLVCYFLIFTRIF